MLVDHRPTGKAAAQNGVASQDGGLIAGGKQAIGRDETGGRRRRHGGGSQKIPPGDRKIIISDIVHQSSPGGKSKKAGRERAEDSIRGILTAG